MIGKTLRRFKIIYISVTIFFLIIGCDKDIEKEQAPVSVDKTELKNTVLEFDKIQVDSVVSLQLKGEFIKPIFDMDDRYLFLTKPGYKGIYRIDPAKLSIDTISVNRGAGYNFCIDTNSIFYVENEYDEKQQRRIYQVKQYNQLAKSFEVLATYKRKVHSLNIEGDVLSYFVGNEIKLIDVRTGEEIYQADTDLIRYAISKNYIERHTKDGVEKIPLSGKNNVSGIQVIDGTRLLVEVASEGLFEYSIIDSSRNYIGDYNSVNYNKTIQSISFVNSNNDGHKVVESRVGIKHIHKPIEKIITPQNILAENPSWSSNGRMLAFNTFDGTIKIAYLSYE